MDIRLARLINGQEVIGEFVEENPMTLTLRNIAVIVPNMDESTKRIEIRMAPFSLFTESNELGLDKGAIIFVAKPVQDIVNQYNTIFGSGIVVPDAATAAKVNNSGLHLVK